MKPPYLRGLFASSGAAAGIAIAAAACVSNTDSGGPEGPDAGLSSSEDGGTFHDDATSPQGDAAPSPDAGGGVDTGSPDAAPQPLAITVLLGGAPEPGIVVAFQDATGAVTGTATTNALGQVNQLIAAGSQVTVAFGAGTSSPSFVTIQDVSPGDTLAFTDTATPTGNAPNVEASLPAPTWDAAGSNEIVWAGSCSAPSPAPIYLLADCAAQGNYPLLAIARDELENEIAYTYQKGNPLDLDGGALLDDAGDLAVTVMRGWTTSSVQQTVTVANMPPLPVDAGDSQGSAITFSEFAGGVAYAGPASSIGETDAGAATETFTAHPGYADFVQSGATYELESDFGNVVSVLAAATRADPSATSQSASFDFSTLPLITAATVGSTDGGTAAAPSVTWTSGGSLSGANGIFVQLQFYTPSTDGGPSLDGTWTILAPPTATSIHAPALPASMPAAPTGGTTYSSPPRVGAIQAPFLPGYAGLRASFGGLSFFPRENYELTLPTLPANGTIYVTGIYPDEG